MEGDIRGVLRHDASVVLLCVQLRFGTCASRNHDINPCVQRSTSFLGRPQGACTMENYAHIDKYTRILPSMSIAAQIGSNVNRYRIVGLGAGVVMGAEKAIET